MKKTGYYERAVVCGQRAYRAHLAKKPHEGEIPIYKTFDHFEYVWNEFYPAPEDTYLIWHPEAFEHPQTYEHRQCCLRNPNHCPYEFAYADRVFAALRLFQKWPITNQDSDRITSLVDRFHDDIGKRVGQWQEEEAKRKEKKDTRSLTDERTPLNRKGGTERGCCDQCLTS